MTPIARIDHYDDGAGLLLDEDGSAAYTDPVDNPQPPRCSRTLVSGWRLTSWVVGGRIVSDAAMQDPTARDRFHGLFALLPGVVDVSGFLIAHGIDPDTAKKVLAKVPVAPGNLTFLNAFTRPHGTPELLGWHLPRLHALTTEADRKLAAEGPPSEWFGEIGTRDTFIVRCEGKPAGPFDGEFGQTYGYRFRTGDGWKDRVMWWTTSNPGWFEDQKIVAAKATPIRHDLYDEKKQTVVSRMKLVPVKDV